MLVELLHVFLVNYVLFAQVVECGCGNGYFESRLLPGSAPHETGQQVQADRGNRLVEVHLSDPLCEDGGNGFEKHGQKVAGEPGKPVHPELLHRLWKVVRDDVDHFCQEMNVDTVVLDSRAVKDNDWPEVAHTVLVLVFEGANFLFDFMDYTLDDQSSNGG